MSLLMPLIKTTKLAVLTVILSTIVACSPEATEQKVSIAVDNEPEIILEMPPTIPATTPATTPSATLSITEQKVSFTVDHDYEIIRETPSATPEITEHFSLYCVHCYNNEPMFKALKATLANDVKFNRSHVLFLPQQRPEWAKAMTFAVASAGALGIEDKFIDTIFDNHFEQKKYIGEYNQLQDIFLTLGVDNKKFQATMNDEKTLDVVRGMVNRASADKIRSTPDLIINNKYRVKLAQLAVTAKEDGITPQQQLNDLVAHLLTNPK